MLFTVRLACACVISVQIIVPVVESFMQQLIDAIDLQAPDGLAEASLLAVCLILALEAGRRLGGWPFAALLTVGSACGYFFIGHVAIPLTVAAAGWIALARSPRPRVSALDFLVQMFFIGAGLILYQFGRIGTRASWEPARDNGLDVLRFERALGLYFEPGLQDRLMSTRWMMESVNAFYSYGFLATVSAVLVYLFIVDKRNYALMRNALGISVVFAVITIALHPTAPPRLLTEAGVIDTVVVEGREHNFTNQYAAIPSLHVGWMVLCGFVLARSIRGWLGVLLGILPGTAMAITVLATGNHFWVDAAIGTLYAVGPALILAYWQRNNLYPVTARVRSWLESPELRFRLSFAFGRPKGRITTALLVALLTYLIVGEIRAPGFTDHWGYLVGQTFGILILLQGLEMVLARYGGISWPTHVVALSALYLDALGTDGNLYANIDEYDKIVHFMGTAAVTACAYELFNALHQAGSTSRLARDRFFAALTVGALVGVGWEVYEYFGDKIFASYRVQSRWDTTNDIISDFLGAVAVVVVLAWLERSATQPARESERTHAHNRQS